MMIWLTIVGMGVITYAIRLSLILLLERIRISSMMRRAFRFVPTAVLSAIILPEMMQPGGQLDLTLQNERLLAGIIAILVAWRTGNVLWTIAAGMGALWLLQAVL